MTTLGARLVVVVVVLLTVWTEVFANHLVVKLNHGGKIRGATLKSQKGRTIYAYRGIPFAEPPTGDLRFKAPVAKSAWSGEPLDATVDGPKCVQIGLFDKVASGQEDCLILNVYTTQPSKSKDAKMAVMVYIHGGGFSAGSSNSEHFGPGLLLDEDVILVTMNYRLGLFGFLGTGDDASRGNYALMDQNLALQWVRDHISVFGGDPNKVTLFGESAGGMSVGFHILSPMSAGLFRAAIAESGSPTWRGCVKEDPLYWAKRLANDSDCPTESTSELVECLRKVPALDLVKKTAYYEPTANKVNVWFSPTVDGTFLPAEPREIIASGKANKVPYINGINHDEGLLYYIGLYLSKQMSANITYDIFRYFLDDQGRAYEAAGLVMDKYFSDLDWTDEIATRETLVKAFSDNTFVQPHHEMVKLVAEQGFSVYTYKLDYMPSFSFVNMFGINETTWGVCHEDDLSFLFDGSFWRLKNANEEDKNIIKVFPPLWANFAKYGDPTPNATEDDPLKWKLSTGNNMQIYHIDQTIQTLPYEPDNDDLYSFWTETIPNVIKKTIPQN